jgi:hypothetical protein
VATEVSVVDRYRWLQTAALCRAGFYVTRDDGNSIGKCLVAPTVKEVV